MTNPSSLLGSFVWYDQMSNDLPGAEAFYTKVVGWTLAPNTMNDQRYTLLKAGPAMIGGLMPIPPEAKGVQPAWMGYIAVDDVKAYADKVTTAGGKIHRRRPRSPMSGRLRSPAIRTARDSCCSRETAARRRRRTSRRPAISAGMSCTPATASRPSPSIRGSSAGRRARRWIWARWASTSSSTRRAARPAA